jgi:hypothetical protein
VLGGCFRPNPVIHDDVGGVTSLGEIGVSATFPRGREAVAGR